MRKMKQPAPGKEKPTNADIFEMRLKLAEDVMRNTESLCAGLWKKIASEAQKGLDGKKKT